MSSTTPSLRVLHYILAGLETGVLGGLLALAWYGFTAVWQGQPLLAAPLRLGAGLANHGFIRGYSVTAMTGLALQIAVSGALGAVFGTIVRGGSNVLRTMVLGIFFALFCYWLCYGLLWAKALGDAPLPASSRSVLVAHLLFGAHLGRYPRLLRSLSVAAR